MGKPVYRPDGFVGQHATVLPEPLRERARRHALLRGLLVTDAGYFPVAEGHFVERAKGAPTTLIILCLRGAGWCRIDGREVAIEAGKLIWLAAGAGHAYGAAEGNPWTIAWVHFTGDEVPAWRELLLGGRELRDPVLTIGVDQLDRVALDRVGAELERGFSIRHLIAAAAMLRMALSAVSELGSEGGSSRSAQDRVMASVEQLRGDWKRMRRLEELATAAGLSVTHYSTLFRRLTGFAPIDFLIRLRVQQACRLLDTTSLAVREVGAQVGYDDPYYFARCFRRVMGCAPRSYRKIPKG